MTVTEVSVATVDRCYQGLTNWQRGYLMETTDIHLDWTKDWGKHY